MAISAKDRKRVMGLLGGCFFVGIFREMEILSEWLAQDNLPKFYAAAFRICLTVGLYYCLYHGYKWARWLMIVLLSIAILGGLVYLVGSPSAYLLFSLVFDVAFLALLLWPKTRIFLHHQRRKYRA